VLRNLPRLLVKLLLTLYISDIIITLNFTVFAQVVVRGAGRSSDVLYARRRNTQPTLCTLCSPVDPVTLCICNTRCLAGFEGRCTALLLSVRNVCVGIGNPTYAVWTYTVNVFIKHFRRKARAFRDGDVIMFVGSFVRLSRTRWWATQVNSGVGCLSCWLVGPQCTIIIINNTYNRLGVLQDRAIVKAGLGISEDRARFLAVVSFHSGDPLHALPIAACGLRLDDEAVRVAVGLRLGINVCSTHLPLWRRGGCARTSVFDMKTCPGAHSQTPGTQWFGDNGLCIGKHPCHQGISWVVEVRRLVSVRTAHFWSHGSPGSHWCGISLSHTRSLLRTQALRLVKPVLQLSWQPTGSLLNMQTSLNLNFFSLSPWRLWVQWTPPRSHSFQT